MSAHRAAVRGELIQSPRSVSETAQERAQAHADWLHETEPTLLGYERSEADPRVIRGYGSRTRPQLGRKRGVQPAADTLLWLTTISFVIAITLALCGVTKPASYIFAAVVVAAMSYVRWTR